MHLRPVTLSLCCTCLWFFPASHSFCQDQPDAAQTQAAEPAANDEPVAAPDPLVLVRQQLQEIQQSILAKRGEVSQARRQLARITDESERQEAELEIATKEADLANLRASFENIALGGLDLSIFDATRQDENVDWQQELQVILKPLFQQLRQLTEKPRQIDRLNSQLASLNSQIRIARRAVENLTQLMDESLDRDTRTRLELVHGNWTQRLADLQRERDISQMQLQVLLEKGDSILQQVRQAADDFMGGRGRNLLLAAAAFFCVYFFMRGLYAGYGLLLRRRRPRGLAAETGRRIMAYIYQAISVVMSVLAVLAVLYITGDILLLVLAMIILIVLMLAMRNYLPRYMEETKLLLNIGAVRERERVIYKDLPWMVRSLGMYSRLYNPALDGLLRLPLSEMLNLVSRPYHEDEPWFPTAVGDWIMMPDGTIGQVLRQTPEIVQLKTRGAVATYPTSSFIASELRNLTEGFGIAVTFGIDYRHQPECTTTVPQILEQGIRDGLSRSEYGRHVEKILVEFKEAGASSLNYQIYVTFKGAVAEFHFILNRLLARICVDTCNEQGWIIPFNQLTVHAGEGFLQQKQPA